MNNLTFWMLTPISTQTSQLSGSMQLLLLVGGVCPVPSDTGPNFLPLPSPDGRRMLPKCSPLLNLDTFFSTKLPQTYCSYSSSLAISLSAPPPSHPVSLPCLWALPPVPAQMFSLQVCWFLSNEVPSPVPHPLHLALPPLLF